MFGLKLRGSWRTSLFGAGGVLTALFAALSAQFDSDPLTQANWGATLAVVFAGLTGIFARDNSVSSEDVGIR